MRKNKILGRVAACVAAGVLVLSSCTACGVNIYSTMDDKIDLVIEGEKNIAQISSIVGSPVACGARLISPDTCIECGQRIRWTDPKNEGW